MSLDNIITAINALDQAVGTVEKTLTKLEQRPRVSRKGVNQMDLFGGAGPLSNSVPVYNGPDLAAVSGRLDRVMTKIKTVLGTAA
jgi:hypothetical protein